MIRRPSGSDWLVVEQIEHARLAAQVARAWGNNAVASLPADADLEWGIAHHDDGWEEWDRAPHLDPATRIPREFLEMRMADATDIWNRSITDCSARPMAGIAVSRHFCFLAEGARGTRQDPHDRNAIDAFLREQAAVQSRLAGRVQTAAPCEAAEFARRCDLWFSAMRFFDAVSLWLCCAERERPETMIAPGGERITFRPERSWTVVVDAYPFREESLTVHAPGRRVAARAYLNDAEFHASLRAAPVEHLAWNLIPA